MNGFNDFYFKILIFQTLKQHNLIYYRNSTLYARDLHHTIEMQVKFKFFKARSQFYSPKRKSFVLNDPSKEKYFLKDKSTIQSQSASVQINKSNQLFNDNKIRLTHWNILPINNSDKCSKPTNYSNLNEIEVKNLKPASSNYVGRMIQKRNSQKAQYVHKTKSKNQEELKVQKCQTKINNPSRCVILHQETPCSADKKGQSHFRSAKGSTPIRKKQILDFSYISSGHYRTTTPKQQLNLLLSYTPKTQCFQYSNTRSNRLRCTIPTSFLKFSIEDSVEGWTQRSEHQYQDYQNEKNACTKIKQKAKSISAKRKLTKIETSFFTKFQFFLLQIKLLYKIFLLKASKFGQTFIRLSKIQSFSIFQKTSQVKLNLIQKPSKDQIKLIVYFFIFFQYSQTIKILHLLILNINYLQTIKYQHFIRFLLFFFIILYHHPSIQNSIFIDYISLELMLF